jgi:ABC-type Fe3+ transport system permease subunit
VKESSLTDPVDSTGILDRPLQAFRKNPELAVVLVVGIVIAYLSLSPTLMLFYGSFRSAPLGVPGDFTLGHYIGAYSDPQTYQLLFNSFIFATGSAILSTALAATLAWISIRTNAPFRRIFELTAIVPNVFPPVMLAVSWTVLLSPRTGLINRTMMDLFSLLEAPFNIYSLWGMIFVESLITTPLAFLIVSASLYSMDPSLEESARVAGSSNFQIARRITFPIIRPALLAATMLNFVRAIESFDTPAIIALPARIEVFTTKIYREAIGAFPPNQNLAATYAVSLLLITMLFVYFYRRLTARSERYVTVTGRGYRPTIIDLGRWRYSATALAGSILVLIVVLPFLVMIYVSFVTYVHVPGARTWELLTLDNYRSNLSDALLTVRPAHHDQHHCATPRRSAPSFDGLRRELPDNVSSHHAAAAPSRLSRRMDNPSDDFFARVQRFSFSLFAGFRASRTAALPFLRRWQSWADVFSRIGRQHSLYRPDLDRPAHRQSRRTVRRALNKECRSSND